VSRGKAELGADRDLSEIGHELADGWGRLTELFGGRPLPVMVPPWNRIAPAVTAALPEWGYRGLSTYKPRPTALGLTIANTHIDIIDWVGTREFVGVEQALGDAIAHLAARREGRCDGTEPTGLLTHHLAHSDGCWRFLPEFVQRTQAHPITRWIHARDIFAA